MKLRSYRVPVLESSQTGEARRVAIGAAIELNFSTTQQGRVGIVSSELATNLVKHSRGGEFIVQEIRCGEHTGLELMTVDSGPGFSDLGKVMRDGFSTAGSQGTGLGAVKRLSDTFDVYSQKDRGSVFVAQLWAQEADCRTTGFQYGLVTVPHPAETANGDSWLLDELGEGKCVVMLVDGLGHGPFASEAARAAVEAYYRARQKEPQHIIQYCHAALRSTRGAAMAMALIDSAKQVVYYAGIGNIIGEVISNTGIRRMVSHDGTVGHVLRKVHEYTYPWSKDSTLVMHSDGLTSHWNLEQYPGLLQRHPSVIAGVLYREYKRRNDDATVLVAREGVQHTI